MSQPGPQPSPSPSPLAERLDAGGPLRLGIVGLGLIGGSIAAAVRRRRPDSTLVAFGRSMDSLRSAREAGLIDEVASLAPAERTQRVDPLDFAVVCTPVDRISAHVAAVAGCCRTDAVITDAGSVKASICRDIAPHLAGGVRFVGSHPLAGKEKQGWQHADPDLFIDRLCVITPVEETAPEASAAAEHFWRRLGSRITYCSPEAHDAALATTSHLPHLVAAALAAGLQPNQEEFVASGFRDTTRIAAGDAELWAAIFEANREAVGLSLDRFERDLQSMRTALEADDGPRLRQLLEQAARRRRALED
jgi:prephenate dehydrogenase